MNKKKKKQSTSKPVSPVAKTNHKQGSTAASSLPAASNPTPDSSSSAVFAQYFSFALLLLVIVLVSVLFYEVMIAFWVPLFLAAVMVVVFRPWYDGIRARFKVGDAIAALLTTASVLLIVLIPLAALLVFAAAESQQVLRQFNSAKALENAKQVRTKLGLELPVAVTQTQVEIEKLSSKCSLDTDTANRHQAGLFEIEQSTNEIADFWELKRPAPAMLLVDPAETPSVSEQDELPASEAPALNDHQDSSASW